MEELPWKVKGSHFQFSTHLFEPLDVIVFLTGKIPLEQKVVS